MKTAQGIVVGLIAGYYDVKTKAGVIRTRARGVFRKQKQKPVVGDQVEIQIDDHGTSYLLRILPRLNRIGRPAVANISHVLLVISAVEPDFSVQLLDRFLTFFAWQKVAVSIYLSKSDLIQKTNQLQRIEKVLRYYEKIGYPIFWPGKKVTAQIKNSIAANQIWTLAGQSGAGKSTLLNHLQAHAHQKTAAISAVLNRGRHTTRQVRLFSVGQGLLADTPGFSAIDLTPIKLKQLVDYFIEFKKASSHCKFRGCQHLQEPGCAVKALLGQGKILASRYEDYLALRKEIKAGKMPEYLK